MLEVIISMAIIAIISIGVYNTYLLLIRQTKDGQVKQMAAVTGKRIIEEIKSINNINDESGEIKLQQDDKKDIILRRINEDSSYTKTLHLDIDFNTCADQSTSNYSYIEEITLTPTKNSYNQFISIDKNIASNDSSNKNILKDYLSLSKEGSAIYIKDSDNSGKSIESQDSELGIYIYLKNNDNKNKIMSVKDYKGTPLLEKELGTVLQKPDNKENQIDLYMDFTNYSTSSDLKNVKIYVSNKNEEENSETNIYLQKSGSLNINVNFNEGQGYVYKNQARSNDKIGILYNIEVKIRKKDSEEYIFTGYSNQNINIS